MKRTTPTATTSRSGTRVASTPRVAKSRTTRSIKATATQTMLSDSDIATRAYEIFKARNGEPGDAVSDWLQAERELRAATN